MYRFIFVDDEDFIRETFAEIMDYGRYGFLLTASFASAEAARAWLKAGNHTDVVLTDIRMGDTSGLQLSEYIRQNMPDIEVVIISGYGEFEYARKAIQCNVFDYLLKPTSLEDLSRLFQRLKEHLDQKGREEQDGQQEEGQSNIIQKVQEYVAQNYANDISLEEIAGQIGMNPAYLSRYFKQKTGKTFMDYLSGIRVNQAIILLKNPVNRVYEIGEMVGYKSLKHFYKIFKKYMGLTPSQYREQWENGGKQP